MTNARPFFSFVAKRFATCMTNNDEYYVAITLETITKDPFRSETQDYVF